MSDMFPCPDDNPNCTASTRLNGRCIHDWAKTAQDPNDGQTTMKCMLSKCVEEAVKLAIIDCVGADQMDGFRAEYPDETWKQIFARCDNQRAEWLRDIYQVPDGLWARIDPGALARNVSCRLLGYGGWFVNGVYGGNGTIQDVVDATFARPDQDHIAEIAFDMGLTPTEDGLFNLPDNPEPFDI